MSQKCLHKGCGKTFTDPAESPCTYHPGPPVFHEGQKGWKCCKPRVLTFDEFMDIPPCTTGEHSAINDIPAPPPQKITEEVPVGTKEPAAPRAPIAAVTPSSARTKPDPVPESEDDDPGLNISSGATCRRRGCGTKYTGSREGEKCVYHPGAPIFHEGSKGYSCCKRRVLEFDQFLKIEGCKEKERHLFVGSGGKDKKVNGAGAVNGNALVTIDPSTVRTDFYQTPTTLVASLFLKQIDASKSTVEFVSEMTVELDLKTTDSRRYTASLNLWGKIDTHKSKFKILGTKLEFELAKSDGASWPALRAGDKGTGEIIQSGRAGRV